MNSRATCTRRFCPPERSKARRFRTSSRPNRRQQRLPATLPFGLGNPPEDAVDVEVPLDRGEIERLSLLDHSDPTADLLTLAGRVHAEDSQRARGRLDQRGHRLDEGRFPRPVSSQETEDLSAADREADPVEREVATVVGVAEVLGEHHGIGRLRHRRAWPGSSVTAGHTSMTVNKRCSRPMNTSGDWLRNGSNPNFKRGHGPIPRGRATYVGQFRF